MYMYISIFNCTFRHTQEKQPTQHILGSLVVYTYCLGFFRNTLSKTTCPEFNISEKRCGRDILQKCTKWSQIGLHGLKINQIFDYQCTYCSV